VYPVEWQESWRELHPGWQYRLWTDADLSDLARAHYPDFVELLETARGVIKGDVGRLLVLHHCGGLYADLDYMALRPMDELVREGAGWVCTMDGYTHNAIMAAVPGYPMMIAAAREALARWQRSPKSPPEWISGPGLIEEQSKRWGPSRWTGDQVCPLDWRKEITGGEWRELLMQCGEAHAVTFWKHNW
jgi:mannosyltransferase OCH1-like enzyme